MRKITLMLLIIQCGISMAQTKSAVTPNGERVTLHPIINNGLTADNGLIELGGELTKPTTITASPTNTLAISGLVASTNSGDSPIVIATDGTLKKGNFPTFNIIPSDVGTVIAIDGKLEVAQEIAVMQATDYPIGTGTGANKVIGNIGTPAVDNQNKFASDNMSNSFTVVADGQYLVTMNAQIVNTNGSTSGNPSIGVWCEPDGKWVARLNGGIANAKMNLSLITAIPMSASKTYSFRATSTNLTATIKALNVNGGVLTYFSIKRL